DGPHGFVGDDGAGDLLGADACKAALDLEADDGVGAALAALGERLAAADDGDEVVGEGGFDLEVDGLVALAEVSQDFLREPFFRHAEAAARLGVADDDVAAAGILQHGAADLAGVRTAGAPEDILRA